MTKKIVFINQATGYLTIDIINEFAREFDEVALISGSVRVQDVPLAENVTISKITRYNRGNLPIKFASWLLGTIQIFYLLVTKYKKHDIFYITIPPTGYLLSLLLKNKFSVLVFDVYPDVLKIYNFNNKSLLYKLWTKWNKKLFTRAHRVYTIGEGMAKLLDVYMDRKAMRIIPNWSGLTDFRVVAKADNPWIKKYNLENKFIVQYSGNIGYTHNVEVLIDIAKKLKHDPEIMFITIGRGEKLKFIQKLKRENDLKNFLILPFQPDDELNYSLAAADLGVVLLNEKIAHVSVPSKIYNLQTVGVPLLVIASSDSELNRHIQKYENGMCFNNEDLDGIANFIVDMKTNRSKLNVLAENSRKAATHFTTENARKYLTYYLS